MNTNATKDLSPFLNAKDYWERPDEHIQSLAKKLANLIVDFNDTIYPLTHITKREFRIKEPGITYVYDWGHLLTVHFKSETNESVNSFDCEYIFWFGTQLLIDIIGETGRKPAGFKCEKHFKRLSILLQQIYNKTYTDWKTHPGAQLLRRTYIMLEQRETFAPGSYDQSYHLFLDNLIEKLYFSQEHISSVFTDLTDAWNCDIITDAQYDTLESWVNKQITKINDSINNF